MVSNNYLRVLLNTFFQFSLIYLGLSSTELNSNGGNITEPSSDSGYKRYMIQNTLDDWDLSTDGIAIYKKAILMNEIKLDSGFFSYWFLSVLIDGDAIVFNKLDKTYPFASNSMAYIPPYELRFGIQNVF